MQWVLHLQCMLHRAILDPALSFYCILQILRVMAKLRGMFRHALKASRNDTGTLDVKLSRFLLTYRNTPCSTTGMSPAELLMKRPLRSRLDLLRPSVKQRVQAKQADQKRYHDAHSKDRQFEVGQPVLRSKVGPRYCYREDWSCV